MFKEFLLKKMLQAKMKDVPQAEQDKMLAMVQKNPDLFMKIASEIQARVKSGADQMTAAMEVMKKYQDEVKKLM